MSFAAGVGSTNIDLIYSGMPRIPNEGEEIYSQGFDLQLGGGMPATLLNLGRLGVPTRIATFLGEDIFSKFAQDAFLGNNVTPTNLYRGSGIPVNITTAVLTQNDRTFISYTDGVEVTDDVLEQVYNMSKGAKIVGMQVGFLEVYRRLKQDGATLVFDTGWDDELSLEKYDEYLRLADYYTPNSKEAMKITGTDSPQAAADVLSSYFERVIVKLDKDGCLLMENGEKLIIPRIPEFTHVDSTGAGDAFLSGLMYGLYHGSSFRQCVLYGNITGGKCITGIGCLSAYVTEQELLALSEKYQHFIK